MSACVATTAGLSSNSTHNADTLETDWVLQEAAANIDDETLAAKLETSKAALRVELLRVGAAGQLHMDGLFKSLPADDDAAYGAAKLFGDDGKVRVDAKAIEARGDAIVNNALAGGAVAVVVLGGAHGLVDKVPSDCAFIRVATKAYKALTKD